MGSTSNMRGFGLVLNIGSFRMAVEIKPTTISGTKNFLLDKKKHTNRDLLIDQHYVIIDHLHTVHIGFLVFPFLMHCL